KGKAVAKLDWTQVGGAQSLSGNWTAEYFNNIDLSGSPVVTQQESMINYVWGGSPTSGVNVDNFSVRWSGMLPVDGGTYRFTTSGDDGIRLWVNGEQIINQWIEQPETSYTADIFLPAGSVPITLEHYDRGGTAAAKLRWSQLSSVTVVDSQSSSSQTFSNWKAEYFNNVNLDGAPVLVRNDQAIDFSWGSSSPFPNVVNNDLFSVRWTRTLNVPAGTYDFSLFSDDGVRLYVNDQTVLDSWTTSQGLLNGTVTVPGGETTIRLEFFEFSGLAEIRLDWDEVNPKTVEQTAVQTIEASPGTAVLKTVRALSVRSGPGIDFDRVGFMTRSTVVQLIGRDQVNFWIQVQLPDGTIGWASSKYMSSPTSFDTLPITQ
ncbi:MAG: PA14 domain-containing protein, partial [Chloroflexota bacterium]